AAPREPMARRRRLVTLTTDLGSAYAAQMKGVLYQTLPPGHVVDIAHDLPAHRIVEAAFLLRHIGALFPSGTVHVAVVDPGVGGARAAVAVEGRDGSFLVGPDNGVLWPLAEKLGIVRTIQIDPARANPGRAVSATFEGRDVFAPAAARLADGGELRSLGTPHPLTSVPLPEARHVRDGASGLVLHVDRFGNAITNVPTSWFGVAHGSLRVRIGRRWRSVPRRRTYSDLRSGVIGLIGSSFGTLELAAREGRAADRLQLEVGRPIAITARSARADGKYRRP
ncbi:MAG: SAM-dependent chlorinase/fluorinase, partial [Thermoplasmata archaeon]|nr:SAM-dependent chlorinase/fluorinase [Thermoplasmata archaeon]